MLDREAFFKNLNDPSVYTFEFTSSGDHFTMMKRKYSDSLTFLYYSSYYGKRTPYTREDYFDHMKFAGIWNGEKIYFPDYSIKRLLNEDDVVSNYISNMADVIGQRISEIVGFHSVEITDKTIVPIRPYDVDVESYINNRLTAESTERFIMDEYEKFYSPKVDIGEISQLDQINSIEDFNGTVEAVAQRYVEQYACRINYWVETEKICRKKILELASNPPRDIVLRKRIYNAVKDMDCQTFTLVLERNGSIVESKIDKNYLTILRTWTCIYAHNLEAKPRAKFVKLGEEMGMKWPKPPSDVHIEEIKEIKFRGKVIYRRDDD